MLHTARQLTAGHPIALLLREGSGFETEIVVASAMIAKTFLLIGIPNPIIAPTGVLISSR